MDRGEGPAPDRGAASITTGHDPQVNPVVKAPGVSRQAKAVIWRPGRRWRIVPVAAAAAAVAILYEAWIFFRFGGPGLTVAVDDLGLAAVVAVAAALTGLRVRRSTDP